MVCSESFLQLGQEQIRLVNVASHFHWVGKSYVQMDDLHGPFFSPAL
jgi:hypothetical protein